MLDSEIQIQLAWLRQQSPSVRKEFIEELKRRHGGFTRAAFRELGFTGPPARGWRKRFVDGKSAKPEESKPSKKQQRRERKKIARERRKERLVNGDKFLESYEWRRLRYATLIQHGRRCMCCGRTPDDGVKIHVDHIKPRRSHPDLALCANNLQILCHECNHGKGNWDQTDWRKP